MLIETVAESLLKHLLTWEGSAAERQYDGVDLQLVHPGHARHFIFHRTCCLPDHSKERHGLKCSEERQWKRMRESSCL